MIWHPAPMQVLANVGELRKKAEEVVPFMARSEKPSGGLMPVSESLVPWRFQAFPDLMTKLGRCCCSFGLKSVFCTVVFLLQACSWQRSQYIYIARHQGVSLECMACLHNINKGPTGISLNHPRKQCDLPRREAWASRSSPQEWSQQRKPRRALGIASTSVSWKKNRWITHQRNIASLEQTVQQGHKVQDVYVWKTVGVSEWPTNMIKYTPQEFWQELLGYSCLPWNSRPFFPLLRLWKASGSQGYQSKGQQMQEIHTTRT